MHVCLLPWLYRLDVSTCLVSYTRSAAALRSLYHTVQPVGCDDALPTLDGPADMTPQDMGQQAALASAHQGGDVGVGLEHAASNTEHGMVWHEPGPVPMPHGDILQQQQQQQQSPPPPLPLQTSPEAAAAGQSLAAAPRQIGPTGFDAVMTPQQSLVALVGQSLTPPTPSAQQSVIAQAGQSLSSATLPLLPTSPAAASAPAAPVQGASPTGASPGPAAQQPVTATGADQCSPQAEVSGSGQQTLLWGSMQACSQAANRVFGGGSVAVHAPLPPAPLSTHTAVRHDLQASIPLLPSPGHMQQAAILAQQQLCSAAQPQGVAVAPGQVPHHAIPLLPHHTHQPLTLANGCYDLPLLSPSRPAPSSQAVQAAIPLLPPTQAPHASTTGAPATAAQACRAAAEAIPLLPLQPLLHGQAAHRSPMQAGLGLPAEGWGSQLGRGWGQTDGPVESWQAQMLQGEQALWSCDHGYEPMSEVVSGEEWQEDWDSVDGSEGEWQEDWESGPEYERSESLQQGDPQHQGYIEHGGYVEHEGA